MNSLSIKVTKQNPLAPLEELKASMQEQRQAEQDAIVIHTKCYYRNIKNGRETLVYVDEVKGDRIYLKRSPDAVDRTTESRATFLKKRYELVG